MIDITSYLMTLGAAGGAVTIVTGWLITNVAFLTKANKTWRQVTAWVVSIAIAFLSAYLGVGIASGLDVVWTAIHGVAVGLVANGIFDIALVQNFLTVIKAKAKPVS